MSVITISLSDIKAQSPYDSLWQKISAAKGDTDMDLQFPISDIIISNGLDDTFWTLRCRPEYSHLWRKFAVWVAKQSRPDEESSINALNVAWKHSEGLATDHELMMAAHAVKNSGCIATAAAAKSTTKKHACLAARSAAWNSASASAETAANIAASNVLPSESASEEQTASIIDAARNTASAASWIASFTMQKQKLIEIFTAGNWVEDCV